jgi:two-component system sensor histidine kinase MtrB
MEDANLHGGWLTAWGRPGLGAQFRLTVPRRAGGVLATSPLPMAPRDLPLLAVPTPDPEVLAEQVPTEVRSGDAGTMLATGGWQRGRNAS